MRDDKSNKRKGRERGVKEGEGRRKTGRGNCEGRGRGEGRQGDEIV